MLRREKPRGPRKNAAHFGIKKCEQGCVGAKFAIRLGCLALICKASRALTSEFLGLRRKLAHM
jgi:hypothetical protein